MPTPLPQIEIPDYAPTLNAFRQGQADKAVADKRGLMKEAGGLAAAGNYKGAMGALYKGGEFDEARGVSGELRAQSAEGRANASHVRAMKNDQLERASKGYETFGRLIPEIKTPEQLEQAKALLKQRGYDFSKVTMDQLPMLRQQTISVSDQLQREQQERALLAQQAQAKLAQSNTDRGFNEQQRQFNVNQGDDTARLQAQAAKDRQAQENWQAEYGIKQGALDVAKTRAGAAAAKAGAAKPLTEGQRKAGSYLGVMNTGTKAVNEILKQTGGKSPYEADGFMSKVSPSSSFVEGLPISEGMKTSYRNKLENQYKQAAFNWLNAKMRHQSGAEVKPSEIDKEFVIFYPQPGDDQQTLRQKTLARKAAEAGMRLEAEGEVAQPGAAGNDISDMSDEDLGSLFQGN